MNLVGPREFLLQVEDELDRFVVGIAAVAVPLAAASASAPAEDGSQQIKAEEAETNGEGAATPAEGGCAAVAAAGRSLYFGSLAHPYVDLLSAAARRYHLQASQQHRGGVRVEVMPGVRPTLPHLSYADFLRPQRGASPPAVEPGGGIRERLLLRAWALSFALPESSPALGPLWRDGTSEAEEVQAAVDAALADGGSGPGSSLKSAEAEEGAVRKKPGSGEAVVRRGRGFNNSDDSMNVEESLTTKHDFRRFSPKAAGMAPSWRHDPLAPWPTVKLRRMRVPRVVWRPEWRVGPDVDDPPLKGLQRGMRGGVLSWAIEPESLAAGEGFEVSLRAGPGPSSEGKPLVKEEKPVAKEEELGTSSAAVPAAATGGAAEVAVCEQDAEDFVLSFRRGRGVWHLTAGKRARLSGLASKTIPDWSADARGVVRRSMFWVACLECVTDSKHYVVAGAVPGILTEHFFVAKVARGDPLSHAGFAHLPTPQQAAFGSASDEQGHPILIESITVFPQGLTGELPFVSRHFVEQSSTSRAVKEEMEDEQGKTAAPLARVGLGLVKEEDPEAGFLELRVRRAPAATKIGEPSTEWDRRLLRECGLPLPPLPRTLEQKEQRRAKQLRAAAAPVVMASDALDAPASWEPRGVDQPEFGPLEETLRHDPKRWAEYVERKERGEA